MELIRDLDAVRPEQRGAVATIGAFDGVHLGHQALLRQLKAKADELHTRTAVISFEPNPREFFMGKAAPPRLQRFREKVETLRHYGVDQLIGLRFNEHLRSLSAREFAAQILHEALGIRWLIVGHDFKFGRNREGTFEELQSLGQRFGFGVDQFGPYLLNGERVSSTLVRQALFQGDMARATTLLGRHYVMSGRVVRGNQLGRTLGFPTANLRLQRLAMPLSGIFAVRVTGAGLNAAPAVASLGTRPTVDGVEPLLEVCVFDYDGDLYGRLLHVEFIAWLRAEQRFPDLDALVAQMHQDAALARRMLAQ